jgi:hypothetical protein
MWRVVVSSTNPAIRLDHYPSAIHPKDAKNDDTKIDAKTSAESLPAEIQTGYLVLYGDGPRLSVDPKVSTNINSEQEARDLARKYGLEVVRCESISMQQLLNEDSPPPPLCRIS